MPLVWGYAPKSVRKPGGSAPASEGVGLAGDDSLAAERREGEDEVELTEGLREREEEGMVM